MFPPMVAVYWCKFNAGCLSAGYDVQSASTPDGVLYITGAPRYNHTGRVVIYRLDEENNIVVSQILRGEQVSFFKCIFILTREKV